MPSFFQFFPKCTCRMTNSEAPDQTLKTFEPVYDKTSKMTCAPNEDSDQPGHSPSLVRVFTVCSIGKGPSVSSCGQRRLPSDWADAQADLSLCCAHRSFCWFCRAAAHFCFNIFNHYSTNVCFSLRTQMRQMPQSRREKEKILKYRTLSWINAYKLLCFLSYFHRNVQDRI